MRQYQICIDSAGIYPMGLTPTEKGIHVSVAVAAKECSLLLFSPEKGKGEKQEAAKIRFPEAGRHGQVWEMTVEGEDLEQYEYAFEADGKRFSDPCGRSFSGNETWGCLENGERFLTTPVSQPEFDWEGDVCLRIPYEECIVYRTHVRGLTKDSSSGVRNKGTFAGVVEKIPYLKELGITTLELMPAAEFQEIEMPDVADGNPYGNGPKPTGRLNYWGYGAAFYYAPKASYAGTGRNPAVEFKKMVKALHQAGMEVVIELFFTGKETPAVVLDVVRFWVREFHVDGVHLTGQAPAWILARDPYLTDTKLWATYWDDGEKDPGYQKNLGEFNDGFLVDMRRALKGDEDQMKNLIFRSRRNPAGHGVINYMATNNGFTLMDMVSYERKHNEANGEENQDGTDYNYTWNCGEEGASRKKKLVQMRRQQLRNALLMVFLSQGTPLIQAGDEFGQSQGGNNNAYCQDNEISWLNWKLQKNNRDLLAFVKQVIAFRKAHPVFHMKEEPKVMDYRAVGKPDISYHGVNAWKPEFENFRRQIGIMYWGPYGKKADGTADETFFVAYNMHWEPHEFALPHLPRSQQWKIAFDTSDSRGYYEAGQEKELENQKRYMVPYRSIIVFVGKPAPDQGKEEKRRKGSRVAKAGKSVKAEEAVKAEKPVKTEEAVKAEKPVKAEETVKTEKPVKAEETVKAGKSVKAEEAVKAEKPVKTEEAVKAEKPVKAEETVKTEKPVKAEETVKTEKPVKAEEPVNEAEQVTQEGGADAHI